MPNQLKACAKCHIEKTKDEFVKQKNKNGTYRLRNFCRCCDNERRKKYYYANREQSLEKVKQYAQSNPNKVSRNNKNKKLKKRYDISIEEYETMLRNQNEQCVICNTKTKLFVDHCHVTGKVRSLLCHQCNTGIGMLKENEEILRNAIEYIRRFRPVDLAF